MKNFQAQYSQTPPITAAANYFSKKGYFDPPKEKGNKKRFGKK